MKSKIKEFLLLSCIAVMALAATACSGSGNDQSDKASSETSAAQDEIVEPETAELPGSQVLTGDPSAITPSSGHKIAINTESGYCFEYDPAGTAEINPKTIMVYTGSEGEVPYYFTAPMRVTDMTTDEYVEYDKNNIVEWYSNRLTEEPVIVHYEMGPWKVSGVEYRFSSEDGTSAFQGYHYMVPYGENGRHMSWTAFFDVNDTGTPKDMHHAMESFRLLAD